MIIAKLMEDIAVRKLDKVDYLLQPTVDYCRWLLNSI